MIINNCPICAGKSVLFIQTKDYNRCVSKEIFDYYKCQNCSLIFLRNVPEDLNRYYPESYYCIPSDIQTLLKNSPLEPYKVEIIKAFKQSGKLLEIGPAWGTFAYLAKQAGYDVEVIEMDQKCCDFIDSKLGIHVYRSNDPAQEMQNLAKYDVIALWHNIEHLHDINRVLQVASEILNPGGIIVIATPNPMSLQLWCLKGLWAHIDAPRHLYLISKEWMETEAKRLGLEAIYFTTTDKGGVGYNSFGWAVSFSNLFKHKKLKSLAYLFGRIVCKLLIPIERTGNRGSAYTIVLKKSET